MEKTQKVTKPLEKSDEEEKSLTDMVKAFYGENKMLSKDTVEYMRQHPYSLEEMQAQVAKDMEIRKQNEKNSMPKIDKDDDLR